MNKELNKQLQIEMEVGLTAVILGDCEEYIQSGISPKKVKDYMTKQGFKCGELDTNGWQYDWWLTFTKAGKAFTAFGTGWTGEFQFSKAGSGD